MKHSLQPLANNRFSLTLAVVRQLIWLLWTGIEKQANQCCCLGCGGSGTTAARLTIMGHDERFALAAYFGHGATITRQSFKIFNDNLKTLISSGQLASHQVDLTRGY